MDPYGIAIVSVGAAALAFAAGYFTRAYIDDYQTSKPDPRDIEAQQQWADLQRIFNTDGETK